MINGDGIYQLKHRAGRHGVVSHGLGFVILYA